jgi:hypothetical protein
MTYRSYTFLYQQRSGVSSLLADTRRARWTAERSTSPPRSVNAPKTRQNALHVRLQCAGITAMIAESGDGINITVSNFSYLRPQCLSSSAPPAKIRKHFAHTVAIAMWIYTWEMWRQEHPSTIPINIRPKITKT